MRMPLAALLSASGLYRIPPTMHAQVCLTPTLSDTWIPSDGGAGEVFGDWRPATFRKDSPRELEVYRHMYISYLRESYCDYVCVLLYFEELFNTLSSDLSRNIYKANEE